MADERPGHDPSPPPPLSLSSYTVREEHSFQLPRISGSTDILLRTVIRLSSSMRLSDYQGPDISRLDDAILDQLTQNPHLRGKLTRSIIFG